MATPTRLAGPGPLQGLLASRAAGITGSAIDASTSLLQRQPHDVVKLAMGSPAGECIPTDAFEALLIEESRHADAFDYGPTEGDPSLRSSLIEFLSEQGRPTSADELLITTGGMQGLDLTCKLFLDPGDLVVVESPTYTNGTATISGYEGRMLEVPTDSEGMDVDALADLVAREPSAPKMIYTIPTFQNPSGTTLTVERRKRLLELASTWGSMILEDDPYEMLRFAGTPLPSLRQLADESVQVVGVHTFSKILAPGLRVGWVSADPVVIEAMTKARQAMDTCTNTLQQRLIARFLGDGRMRLHLEDLREQYSLRKEAMQAALSEELAGLHTSWTDPGGGFFLWLTLPEGLDSGVLFPIALEEGVAYIPGEAFSVSGLFSNAVRLAFSAEQPERARLGVRKLRRAIDRYYMA